MKDQFDIQFLRNELQTRIKANPRYSMRAFASLLGTDIGTLSKILSGKRILTAKAARRFCDGLNFAPDKRDQILGALTSRSKSINMPRPSINSSERKRLENEIFTAMSEWQHMAILQLVRVDGYRSRGWRKGLKWFSARLGLTEALIKMSLDRLVALDMLKYENGRYHRLRETFTTANKLVSTPALRQMQKAFRLKAIESLEGDPIEKRSMTSMTMAIDPAKLRDARDLIDKFESDLSEFLEAEKRERVYQLTISLFPLDRGDEK
jgi:uncharacterized protein (TIGR02147 family)